MHALRPLAATLVLVLATLPTPALARAHWKVRIDRLARGHSIGIAVRDDGRVLYENRARKKRIPASNQKLLLSMVAFARLGARHRVTTSVAAGAIVDGVVQGDLWIIGRGDPSVASSIDFSRSLPFKATRLGELMRRVKELGITRVRGRVMGTTGYFLHDWFAPGWEADFPRRYVALPSALSLNGNVAEGRHFSNPEFRTARAATRKLERIGVAVTGRPGAGPLPVGASEIASIRSVPLARLIQYMNRKSSNFFAEVLGKGVAVDRFGEPGTIERAARAISLWTRRRGVDVVAHDASGLSYENRISARGLTRLLARAESRQWGPTLMLGLPGPGEGTLEDRLAGIPVLAKTGTLDGISALSGWVWADRLQSWIEFSILSRGLPKWRATVLEDRVVRILAASAR